MISWYHIICFVGRSRLAFRLGTWSKVEKGPETLAMAKRAMPSDVPRGPLGGAPTTAEVNNKDSRAKKAKAAQDPAHHGLEETPAPSFDDMCRHTDFPVNMRPQLQCCRRSARFDL